MIPIPTCTVVTSPVNGRLSRLVDDGTQVAVGDVVATVESGGRAHELTAPWPGRIAGPLAGLTQPVAAGEGVVWLARA